MAAMEKPETHGGLPHDKSGRGDLQKESRHCFERADIIGGSNNGERDDSAKQSSQMVASRSPVR